MSISQIEKKVEKRPENYLSCNDCDRYTSTNRPIHKDWEEITHCPYCDSENLERLGV